LEYNDTVHYLFINLKKAYVSIRMKIVYSILPDLRILKELVRLIKILLLL
jgi:hypothetical protein